MELTYKLHLQPEPEGGFTVVVPVLPGCITYGESVEEAVEMAKDAIGLYIEELKSQGLEIPDDANSLEYSLRLSVAWTCLLRYLISMLIE